jgi:aminocarboxymuconate-semialdehyde decarboxylase
VTAAVAGRWQRGVQTARPGIEELSMPVAEAVRSFYVDDLVHDEAMLQLLVRTFGAAHVLAGSDWPFPMGSDGVAGSRAVATGELTVPLAKEVSAE